MKTLIAAAFAILALLFVAAPVMAEERATDWTTQDTVLQATMTALLVVDWGQTLWIADHTNNQKICGYTYDGQYLCQKKSDMYGLPPVEEINPALGDHPSRGTVNAYFGIAIPAHAAISYGLRKSGWRVSDIPLMPQNWGTPLVTVWQSVSIGFQGANDIRNVVIGVGMAF
jgi:hypothetical protein